MKPSVDVFFSRQVSPRPVLSRSRRQRRVGHLRGGKKARLSGRSHGRGRSLPERRAVPTVFLEGAHRWRCVGRKRPLVVLDPAFGEGHAPKLIWGGPLKPRFLFLFCYFSSALSALARSIDLGWRTIYSLSSGIPSLSAVRIKKETPLFVKLGAAVRSRGYRWSGASTQRPYVSSEFLKKKSDVESKSSNTRGFASAVCNWLMRDVFETENFQSVVHGSGERTVALWSFVSSLLSGFIWYLCSLFCWVSTSALNVGAKNPPLHSEI